MINLARGGVTLTVIALLVGIFYYQRKVEAVTVVASDSQNEIQKEVNETQQTQDKDKVNNNSTKTDKTQEVTVKIDNSNNPDEDTKATANVRSFTATAYCLKGRTASGSGVRRGIVAADPRVLPLGTTISLDAGAYSGSYLVADTGGAVKGRKLDIWVPNCSEARRFGRRSVKVKVSGKRKRGK